MTTQPVLAAEGTTPSASGLPAGARVTTATLAGAAAVALMTSGLLYGLIQFVHPTETVAAVQTTRWQVVHIVSIVMAVTGLAGLTGIYLGHVGRLGRLGLVGYLAFGSFYLLTAMYDFFEAFVLPELAVPAPHLTQNFNSIFAGGDTGSLGAVTFMAPLGFVLYLIGGTSLGIAVLRARILARWSALLLTFGTVLTLAVPAVPHQVARGAALPVGLAVAGLGWAQWTIERRKTRS